jgi:S1-C subfamily serine protease
MKLIRRHSHDSNPSEDSFTRSKSKEHQERKQHLSWRQSLIYLLLGLTGAGVVVLSDRWIDSSAFPPPGSLAQSLTPSASSRLLSASNSNFIATAVERVGSAVVRIDSTRTITARLPNILNRRFFGAPSTEPPQTQVRAGTGSGFVIDSSGLVLTNAHVIDGANQVIVTLRDGRTFKGEVLGEDPVTDVAVVRIQATNLPKVALGNSESLRPGEWAIAIGNPLGLDNTVTVGIVSATGRTADQIGVSDRRVGFIQTDAAINPGNSGGPLLNQQGEVIGMNTAIIGGAQGLGFAIPIHTAQRVASQLIKAGHVEHSYLGVQMMTLTPALKDQLNNSSNTLVRIQETSGVLIVGIAPNAPAERAGLYIGDVVHKINNQAVTKSEQVQQIVENSSVGSELNIELRRNGTTQVITVQSGALPTQRMN